MRRAFAIGGLLLLAGCEEPLGPMSPETVDAITKMEGDAIGFDRSGTYAVVVDPVACPCEEMSAARPGGPTIDGLAVFSLCSAVDQAGVGATITVDVLATDGVVTFSLNLASGVELVGPLYDGGGFAAGSVTSITSFVAEGRLVTRMDGDFDRTGDGHDFEATLVHRIAGRTTIGSTATAVDCTEELDLAGTIF